MTSDLREGLMPVSRDELLLLAAAVADYAPVDWEQATREHPELLARLERLKHLERIAAGHRAL